MTSAFRPLVPIFSLLLLVNLAYADGFNSTFDSDASGWEQVDYSWEVSGGIYAATSFHAGRWTSVTYDQHYANFEYVVRMRRVGQAEGNAYPAAIFVRGGGNTLATDTDNDWTAGYSLRYKNNGEVAVVKKDGYQSTEYLLDWTSMPDVLATQDGWETLKVVANGSHLEFYVNDHQVWSGQDSTFGDGYVGAGCLRDIYNNTCEVDSAVLTVGASGGGSGKLTIRGTVKTKKNQPVGGVKIRFTKAGQASTNAKGAYTMSVDSGYSGSATPSKKGKKFSPKKRTYSNVKKNLSKQNYIMQ
jgi:hypothetical protein